MTFISRWLLMKLCLKAQRWAACCHGSGYLWPRLRAHSRCQVERGDGESRRPLAVLAIGSEKRRNVGQLCHPFEVGTACLWSGGRAPGFHVLLSCDLRSPRLHKPYWLYRLKKKKKNEKNTDTIYSSPYGTRKPEALWSQMNERAVGISRPALDMTYKQTNIELFSRIDSLPEE